MIWSLANSSHQATGWMWPRSSPLGLVGEHLAAVRIDLLEPQPAHRMPHSSQVIPVLSSARLVVDGELQVSLAHHPERHHNATVPRCRTAAAARMFCRGSSWCRALCEACETIAGGTRLCATLP